MYITWVALHLLSALSRRVGALQISIVIIIKYWNTLNLLRAYF